MIIFLSQNKVFSAGMKKIKQKSTRKIAGEVISYASLKKGGFHRGSMDGFRRIEQRNNIARRQKPTFCVSHIFINILSLVAFTSNKARKVFENFRSLPDKLILKKRKRKLKLSKSRFSISRNSLSTRMVRNDSLLRKMASVVLKDGYFSFENFIKKFQQACLIEKKKFIKTFSQKTFAKRAVSFLVIFIIVITAFLNNYSYTKGATYTWQQTSWSGGATANYAAHPANQTSWNEYFAKDANTDIINGGNDVSVAWTAESSLQTSSTGEEDTHNSGGFNSGTNTNTKVFGAGATAGVKMSFAGVAALSAGQTHVLAIRADDSVWAWGANGNGQLGESTITNRYTPVQVLGEGGAGYLEEIEAVSAGSSHSLALRADGTVFAWGNNDHGQLGDNTVAQKNSPIKVVDSDGAGDFTDVVAIAAGDRFSLALKSDGTVWAWGLNTSGQLGDGTVVDKHLPVQVLGTGGAGTLSGIQNISAGGSHAIALKSDSTVWTWGLNANGQLGDNTIISKSTPVQVLNEAGDDFLGGVTAIASGSNHSLGVMTDGTVRAWGLNDRGQLGDNTIIEKHLPVQVLDSSGLANLSNIISINGGFKHSLAIDSSGNAWAWGYNGTGQLADNTLVDRYLPSQVMDNLGTGNLANVKFITGGHDNSYAFQNDGTLWTWGDNVSGQLGNNTTTGSRLPLQTWGPASGFLSNVSKIASGYSHTLALKNDGTVWAWGWNGNGQLGDNTTTNRLTPIQVLGSGGSGNLTDVVAIAAGYSHSFALKSDGTVWAWGWNGYGQLGDNSTMNRYTPTQVTDSDGIGYLTDVESIACGNTFTLVVKTDGTVWTWGNNSNGQLGDNTTNMKMIPVQVVGPGGLGYLSGVSKVAGGEKHSLALKDDGTVWSWGYNSNGQLGNNTTQNESAPIQVFDSTGSGYLQNISSISAGYLHSVALMNNGTVWAWGWNGNGQIGNGTIVDAHMPSQVVGAGGSGTLNDVSSVACGNAHTVAMKTDNTVWAWGWNGYGQLGDNSSINKNYPVQALDSAGTGNLSSIGAITAGYGSTASLSTDGNSVWNWGMNNYGQLGTNNYYDKSLPLKVWGAASGTLVLGVTHYNTAGSFSSVVVDTGSIKTYTTMAYLYDAPAGSTVTLDVRAGDNGTPDGTWTSWIVDVSQGGDISSLGQHRYYQYRVNFTTTDDTATPRFQQATISYEYYPSPMTLTSTMYNTSDGANILSKIRWNETVPSGTDVRFQVRTAVHDGSIPGTWTSWMGPDGTGASYFTDKNGGESMPSVLRDGLDDQWIQYRAFLVSDGLSAPNLSDVTMQYVVNAPPELRNVSASQGSNGIVTVNYETRDTDTLSGATPGNVEISLQYCSANCSAAGSETWVDAATVGGNVGAGIAVQEVNWSTYQLTWNPKIDYPQQFNGSNFKVRVKANDSEGANNLGYNSSNVFIIDTKNPTNVAFSIDHTQNLLSLDTPIDDSSYQMMVSNFADFNDTSYQAFQSSYVYGNLTDDPATVYLRIGDAYGNYTDISVTTPAKPLNTIYYDASDVDNDKYRELIVWDVIDGGQSGAGFAKYNIWRSSDGINYGSTPVATNEDRLTNYYLDADLVAETRYYYKITAEDVNGSISAFSNITSDIPDGNGEVSSIPPVISNIQISNVTTTTAQLNWQTDVLANATVGFSTVSGDFTSEIGVTTMGTEHSVTLTGLTPGQTYYYQVKSADQYGNVGIDDSQAPFITDPLDSTPPAISSLNAITTEDAATITWDTDESSNSFVEYSLTQGFPAGLLLGTNDMVTSHSVTLSGLSSSATYYYRVHSRDAMGNEAVSAENNFSTLSGGDDSVAPVISNVAAAVSGADQQTVLVTWDSDEAASSFVEFGPTVAYGRVYGSSDLSTSHSIELPHDLGADNTYQFRVFSQDSSGNTGYSTNDSFATGHDDSDPVISAITVEELASDSALISWHTDKATRSLVLYGTEMPLTNNVNMTNYATDHFVLLSGLNADDSYLFTITATDAYGNAGTSSPGNFTTEKPTEQQHDPLGSIDNVSTPVITDTKAVVSFDTDQEAECTIEFGTQSGNYTEVPVSEATYDKTHSIHLAGLIFETTYYYKVTCQDNLSTTISSDEYSFVTSQQQAGSGGGSGTGDDDIAPKISSIKTSASTGDSVTISWTTDEEANSLVKYGVDSKNMRMEGDNLVNTSVDNFSTSHSVVISGLVPYTKYYYSVVSYDVAGNITESAQSTFATKSPSSLSSIKAVPTSINEATITWSTNQATTSIIEYGLSNSYGEIKESGSYVKNHELVVSGLQPAQTYHFRVKGKDQKGTLYSSSDYTFESKAPPQISNIAVESVTENGAVVKFSTNVPTDALVSYIDQGNPANSGTQGKPDLAISHEVELENLESGVAYNLSVIARDEQSNEAKSQVVTFSTGKDDTAPKIDKIKTENALTQNDKVQSIISWTTNEPATTVLSYKERRNGEEKEIMTEGNSSQTHIVVVTIFKPGTVYYFKVKSKDQSGNESTSGEFALLTPKKKENIVQLIINNFQEIFGWAKIK